MPRSVEPPRAEQRSPREGERIAKLLARAGVASRREVERMIEEGRVARDGAPIATPATVLSSLAGVTVDGQPVAAPEAARLFLYHKPVGLLVTERDPRGRPTIYDRLPGDLPRLVPVGRLDLNTEGLLLLTTDGALKRQLELPSTGVERTYRARVYGPVSQAQLEALIDGIEIDGVRYGAIDANLERRTGANGWIELTLTEGKNREVRRVLEHLGLRVGRLIRTRYGPFLLADLPPDGIGEVRAADLEGFRRTLGKREQNEHAITVASNASPGPMRRPMPKRPAHAARQPDAARLPGAGGGPGSAKPVKQTADRTAPQKPVRPSGKPQPTKSAAPPPGPGLRRGGEQVTTETTPRPAKPQRKPGWARPKPKTGPGKPRR